MFGIATQEMVIVGLLALVVFGPGKLPQMARDLGRFVSKARASMEEFKSELASEEAWEDPHERREKDREPGQREPGAGRWELGSCQETAETARRRPVKPGEARDGNREAAEDKGLEEGQHREPTATGPSEN